MMPPGEVARILTGAELSLRRLDERLSVGTDATKTVVSWLAFVAAAIVLSGVCITKIPACRIYGRRGRIPRLTLPGFRNNLSWDTPIFGLSIFISQALIFGLFARQPIQIFFQRVGLNLGQLSSLAVFSAFASLAVSLSALIIYQSVSRLRRAADPFTATLESLLADSGAARYQRGYEDPGIPPSLGKR